MTCVILAGVFVGLVSALQGPSASSDSELIVVTSDPTVRCVRALARCLAVVTELIHVVFFLCVRRRVDTAIVLLCLHTLFARCSN